MSKKLAEGLDALVLDVKTGRGAFMKDLSDARVLAATMVGIGRAHGTAVTAVITDMSQPLGREVGNACEIVESVDMLRGGGPADLVEITYTLAEHMLVMVGIAPDRADARARLEQSVRSGAALAKLVEVVEAQGGDPAVLENTALLPSADNELVISAVRSGVVSRCDALDLGVAASRLGAGRATKEDTIDPGVGLTVEVKIGDPVAPGDPLLRIRWNDPRRLEDALALTEGAIVVDDGQAVPPTLIYEEVR